MTTPTFDNGIPELTEVIAADTVANTAKSAPAAATPTKVASNTVSQVPAPKTTDESVQAHAIPDWQNEQWHQLEDEIKERLTRQVLARIDFVLEQRVRDSLADVLQTAVEGLSNEIRQGLHATLEDVIARALAQEIAKLKASKN
jgi:protein required for attachment to host cells